MINEETRDQIINGLTEICNTATKLIEILKPISDEQVVDGQLLLPFEEEEQKPMVSLEEVRTVLARLSQDGFTNDVKNLISSFGATRLSDINPTDFYKVLEKSKEIGNA